MLRYYIIEFVLCKYIFIFYILFDINLFHTSRKAEYKKDRASVCPV